MLRKGIIINVQGYSRKLTIEIIRQIQSAGAVAIQSDKPVEAGIPILGFKKIKCRNKLEKPYITPGIKDVKDVRKWAYIVIVDYRRINNNIKEISDYCKMENIGIIGNIGTIEDYFNIQENDFYYNYISIYFSKFHSPGPDYELIKQLQQYDCKNIIAEGNFKEPEQVRKVYDMGINHVCVGTAVTNIFRLTKRFTSVKIPV